MSVLHSVGPATWGSDSPFPIAPAASRTPSRGAVIEPAQREQELSRQLDQRLTERLSRLRQSMQPQHDAETSAAEGVGSQLDIRV